MYKEILTESDRVEQARTLLKQQFAGVDERWVIGHRGNQGANLVDEGILPDTPPTVLHAHASMGVEAERVYPVPEGSAGSYEGLLTKINPGLEDEIIRVVSSRTRVALFMPFPNAGFDALLAQHPEAWAHLVNTCTVIDFGVFQAIEDKVRFGHMLDDVLHREGMDVNVIPHSVYRPGQSFSEVCGLVGARTGDTVYFQRALSAGGDGTIRVGSQEEMDHVMRELGWADGSPVKVALGIHPNYPCNGTGCIVPTEDGSDCYVYLDPPSHKPVGLPELGAKQGSGVGNDWSVPLDDDCLDQYSRMVTAVGKEMFLRYGYTGLFGPDGIIDLERQRYHMTEVNPRWQGTTPYQTANALMNGRIPLEWMHYLTKFAGNDPHKLADVRALGGDVEGYNKNALHERGGFYMKMGAPKDPRMVLQDMNGAFAYHEGGLAPLPGLSQRDVYAGRHGFQGRGIVVHVTAPKPGEMVGGELAPIGYIAGSGQQVFDSNKPAILPEALRMYNMFQEAMFTHPVVYGQVFG